MELTELTEKIMYMKLGKGQNSNLHADTFECEFFLQMKTDAWNNKKAIRSLIFHDTWSFVHWPPVLAKITINIWTWDWQKKICLDVDKLCESLNWLVLAEEWFLLRFIFHAQLYLILFTLYFSILVK